MTTPCLCAICGMPFEARTSYGLCPLCWQKDRLRECDRLQTALHTAMRRSLPATLTLVQWLSTVSDWNGLCAYCQEFTFSFIEMVEPAGGLTYENVVPCCRACAKHKHGSFEEAAARVAIYLAGARDPLAGLPQEEVYA